MALGKIAEILKFKKAPDQPTIFPGEGREMPESRTPAGIARVLYNLEEALGNPLSPGSKDNGLDLIQDVFVKLCDKSGVEQEEVIKELEKMEKEAID